MKHDLVQEFFSDEANSHVIDIINLTHKDAVDGHGPRRKALEFNRFEVILDIDREEVVLEDVLDPAPAGKVKLPLMEFLQALNRKVPPRGV